jgi:hypothetical protein
MPTKIQSHEKQHIKNYFSLQYTTGHYKTLQNSTRPYTILFLGRIDGKNIGD